MGCELEHHRTVPESHNILIEPLNSSGRDLCDLLGVDAGHTFVDFEVAEAFQENLASWNGTEVDESISNIALVLEIDGHVDKVELTLEIGLFQLFHQHISCILVWDVPEHDGCEGAWL